MYEYTLSCDRVIAGLRSGLAPSRWLWKPLELGVAPVKGVLNGVFLGGCLTLAASLGMLALGVVGAVAGQSIGSDAPILLVPGVVFVAVAVTTVWRQSARRRHSLRQRAWARAVVTLLERAIDIVALERTTRVISSKDVLHVAVWATHGKWFSVTLSDATGVCLELSLPGTPASLRALAWPAGATVSDSPDEIDHALVKIAWSDLDDAALIETGRALTASLRGRIEDAEAPSPDARRDREAAAVLLPRREVLTADPSPARNVRVTRAASAQVQRMRRLGASWARGARLCAWCVAAQLPLGLFLLAVGLSMSSVPRVDWLALAIPGALLLWGVMVWTLLFDLHLASPVRPGVVEEPPLELLVEDGPRRLRQGNQEITLEEPFDVVVTRAPDARAGAVGLFGVEVRQRGAARTPSAQRVRFSLSAVSEDVALDEMPLWQQHGALVPAATLCQSLWPTLAFYSAVHNRPLPVTFAEAAA